MKRTSASCTLVPGPRPMEMSPKTAALSRRALPEPYIVAFNGGTAETQWEMDPGSICMDPKWVRRHPQTPAGTYSRTPIATSKRMYTNNLYVPIPLRMFEKTNTRVFDFEVKAFVSIADNPPVAVEVFKRLRFSHFIKIKADNYSACTLQDGW